MRLAKQILVDIIKEEVKHVLERRKKFRVYRMFSRDYSGEELMNRLENPKIKPIKGGKLLTGTHRGVMLTFKSNAPLDNIYRLEDFEEGEPQ